MESNKKDRISDLPDEMLCHILSFLPTKQAASTSVLAKRWKSLFAYVPSLDFDDSNINTHPPMINGSFMRFVDRILALQGNAQINRFHLRGRDVFHEYRVLDWILNVLNRGVSDIYLSIYLFWGVSHSRLHHLPPEMFVSETLVRLTINFDGRTGIDISVEGDVFLPKLKSLHLNYFMIKISTFNKLLSGCHALEELELINLMWDKYLEPEPFFVAVSIPTLKRLIFRGYEQSGYDKSLSLSFDTPNLVYVEYFDTMAVRYQQVSFDSLVEARLGLRLTYDVWPILRGCRNDCYLSSKETSNVTNFLTGVHNVKILYLSVDILQVIRCCPGTVPLFNNLIHLTIETKPEVPWKPLPAILKNCPNLVTLVFEGLHHIHTFRCRKEDWCLCKYRIEYETEVVARTCLSSSPVKVLEILNFDETYEVDVGIGHGLTEKIKQVKHFINKMPNLEQVILRFLSSNDEDAMMKVFKILEKLPRVASSNCKIQVISGNLSLSSKTSD